MKKVLPLAEVYAWSIMIIVVLVPLLFVGSVLLLGMNLDILLILLWVVLLAAGFVSIVGLTLVIGNIFTFFFTGHGRSLFSAILLSIMRNIITVGALGISYFVFLQSNTEPLFFVYIAVVLVCSIYFGYSASMDRPALIQNLKDMALTNRRKGNMVATRDLYEQVLSLDPSDEEAKDVIGYPDEKPKKKIKRKRKR